MALKGLEQIATINGKMVSIRSDGKPVFWDSKYNDWNEDNRQINNMTAEDIARSIKKDDGNSAAVSDLIDYATNPMKYSKEKGSTPDLKEFIRVSDRTKYYNSKRDELNSKLAEYTKATNSPTITADDYGFYADPSNIKGGYKAVDQVIEDIGKQVQNVQSKINNWYTDHPTTDDDGDTGRDDKTDPIKNPKTYEPSQAILDVEKKIRNIIDNPESIDAAKVTEWQNWLNSKNKEQDAAANTRLLEQYSALGDLGSSSNRQALAQLAGQTQLGRSQQAVGMATQDLLQRNQQTTDALNKLMGIGTYEDNLRLIPINQSWQEYQTKLGNKLTQANMGLQNAYNTANAQVQRNWQTQDYQTMLDMVNANKPKEQEWWQPLVNVGLGAAGMALGGPIGGMIGSGIGSLFGAPAQNQPTSSVGYRNIGMTSTGLENTYPAPSLNLLPGYTSK